MTLYTPQMLNTYAHCPKEYYFRFEKNIPTPVLESNFVVGKNIHAIASYYLKGEDIEKYKLNERESKLWQNILSNKYFQLKPEKIETSVMAKIDEYWIGGRIDALVKDEHENYFILDYKTGKIPENKEQNFQTIVYLLACDKLLKSRNELSFVYISAKDGKSEIIKFSDELKEKYEYEIKNICANINMLSHKNIQKSDRCQNCQYLKICV